LTRLYHVVGDICALAGTAETETRRTAADRLASNDLFTLASSAAVDGADGSTPGRRRSVTVDGARQYGGAVPA
jgi:hypothetical protein